MLFCVKVAGQVVSLGEHKVRYFHAQNWRLELWYYIAFL